MASATRAREGAPPPVIGKAGSYTVFITPPPTPKPSQTPHTLAVDSNSTQSPKLDSAVPPPPPPPVQVPPQQLEKAEVRPPSGGFGFFWNAVGKLKDVHSSLDDYLADWFGLDQSKYQWALNDYYDTKGIDKEGKKDKELVSKGQTV